METIAHATKTKANKEHRCDFCNGRIGKGDTYLKSTHKMDGDVYDFKTHDYCADLAHKLKMYENVEEGVDQEMFMETVSSTHYDLMLGLFSEDELKKCHDDVLNQLRYVGWREKFSYVLRHFKRLERANLENNPTA